MATNKVIDAMWDDSPIDVSAEVNFSKRLIIRRIQNCRTQIEGYHQIGICPLFSGVSVFVSITPEHRSFIKSLHGIIASTPAGSFL